MRETEAFSYIYRFLCIWNLPQKRKKKHNKNAWISELNGPPYILALQHLMTVCPLGKLFHFIRGFFPQFQAKNPNANSVSSRFVGEKMDCPVSSGTLSNFRSGLARRHADGCTHYDVMGITLAWPQVWDGLMPRRGITGSWSPSIGLLGPAEQWAWWTLTWF